MKKDLTERVFILDRSGSMAGLEKEYYVRASRPMAADWKKRIDEDFRKRGGK